MGLALLTLCINFLLFYCISLYRLFLAHLNHNHVSMWSFLLALLCFALLFLGGYVLLSPSLSLFFSLSLWSVSDVFPQASSPKGVRAAGPELHDSSPPPGRSRGRGRGSAGPGLVRTNLGLVSRSTYSLI